MAKIDKEMALILRELNQDNPAQRTPIPKSVSYLRPGNVLIFKYNLEDEYELPHYRIALVVKNDLGTVSYISLRNNLLISTFRLNDVPEFITNFVLKTLYNNKSLCVRKLIIEGLTSLLGKLNYRTYKLNNMEDLQKLEIIKSKFPEVE